MTDTTALTAALARCAAALGHPAEVTFRAHRGYLYAALGERWESSPGVPCATSEDMAWAERESLRLLATLVEHSLHEAQAARDELTRAMRG